MSESSEWETVILLSSIQHLAGTIGGVLTPALQTSAISKMKSL